MEVWIICSVPSDRHGSRGTCFGNIGWPPLQSSLLLLSYSFCDMRTWEESAGGVQQQKNNFGKCGLCCWAAGGTSKMSQKQESLFWAPHMEHGRFNVQQQRNTVALESSEKRSPSMASPPTLPSEHPKLECKALSPRINWIKISPIWNVHLILENDVSNICKRFLY